MKPFMIKPGDAIEIRLPRLDGTIEWVSATVESVEYGVIQVHSCHRGLGWPFALTEDREGLDWRWVGK